MERMTTTTVDGFSTSFTAVVGDFRRFLENESRNGTSSLDDETAVFNESMSDLNVCIEINRRASCARGTQFIPLLQFYDVISFFLHHVNHFFSKLEFILQEKIGFPKNENKTAPHCLVFLDDKDILKSMIIYCGNGISFSVNNLQNEAAVFLNLLSVYFCFDIDYPACYSILPLLEHLSFPECSDFTGQIQSAPPTRKSKKLKTKSSKKHSNPLSKMSVTCKNFLRIFQASLSSD